MLVKQGGHYRVKMTVCQEGEEDVRRVMKVTATKTYWLRNHSWILLKERSKFRVGGGIKYLFNGVAGAVLQTPSSLK